MFILENGDIMFIGRTDEIKEIKAALNSSRFEGILLYGVNGKIKVIKKAHLEISNSAYQ